MAETLGTVAYLKVNKDVADGTDFGLFGLLPQGGGGEELFFIWWTAADSAPATAADWVVRNMHFAMLRDALVQKLPVVVRHDDFSSFYTSLELDAS